MLNSQHWIERHWRRLQWGQFLGVLADQLAMTLIALGGVILLVKLFLPPLWPHVLWLFAGLLLVPVFSWRKLQRRKFTRGEATALLDDKLRAGGLLMTLSEAPDEEWHTHLPTLQALWANSLPRLRPKRFAPLVTIPLLFVMIACLIPLREETPLLATPRPVAQQATDDLQAILKTLEEAEVLEEEQQKKLQEEITKFREETHNQPLTHEQWETADFLRQQMQMQWQKNERSITAAASAVEEMLAALAENHELTPEQMQQLENALGENLQSMAKKAGQGKLSEISDPLRKALESLAQSGQMKLPQDPAERQKILDELKEKLEKESECLAKQRSECQGLCQGNGQCDGEMPGQGGISRGPGSAPMYWGKESELAGTKFKELALPSGTLEDPAEEVLSVTKYEPEVNPAESAPRQALRDNDPSAGRATWDRKHNPKHRGVVRKFFDSERQPEAIPADAGL